MEDRFRIGIVFDEVGVDFIEVGYLVVSGEIFEGICFFVFYGFNVNILVYLRVLRSDIDFVLKVEVEWIGIFMCFF